MALFHACPPEQPHNRAVWSDAGCARLFRPFDVESPPKGSLDDANYTMFLQCVRDDSAQTTRDARAKASADRNTPVAKAFHKDGIQQGMHERESFDDERELVATLQELYGRASEVARRVLEDARILEVLHGETSELLHRLRSVPTTPARPTKAPPPAAPTPSDSGPRLPRLISFREVGCQ